MASLLRELLFDLGKIVEGAASGDPAKVAAYSHQLGDKLDAAGEPDAARRVREIVAGGKLSKLGLSKGAKLAPLPVDGESRLPVADEANYPKGSVDLFLPGDAQELVEQFLAFYRAAGQFIAQGVGITPTMLIHGPPGCGKTQLAKYIAAEAGLPLLTARTDSLVSSYLGSTSKNLRQLFDHAASRPCVLFLDEFDALAKMRDDERELGELKRVVISLLQNIDASGRDTILLAATNHDHLLDPAIWRRFAYRLRLAEPSPAARADMARAFLGRFGTAETVEALVACAGGLAGSFVRQVADDSIRKAILAGRDTASVADVVSAAAAGHPRLADTRQGTTADRARAIRALDPKFFTQDRLAAILGVSQPTVSKLLKGGAG